MKKIKTYLLITQFFVVFSIIGIVFFVGFGFSSLAQHDAYYGFHSYKKKYIKFDSLINYGSRYVSYGALINKYENFECVSFTHNQEYAKKMDSIFVNQKKYLTIFFKDYESPAYFVEDDFQEMSFKTIWVPALIKLGIFVLTLLNFLYWRRQYHQAILATGMTVKEYEAIEKAKRPKRKSLQEEYEELMKKENEKNKEK